MSHSSPAAFIARIVEKTTRTTVGTQSVTFSGIGTVKGFYILGARVSAEDTLTAGYSVCTGFGDDTGRERCVSTWGEDAVADTDCGTQGTRNFVLRLLNPTSGSPLVEAHYNGLVTDGIELNYVTVEGTAWLFTVVLFAGEQTECYVGDEIPNTVGGAAKTVTTGIAQDFCMVATMPTVSETTSYDHAVYIPGIATRDDTDNFCVGMVAHDGEAIGRSRRLSRNDTCGYNVIINGASALAVVGTAITNHTSTGFGVSSVGTAGNTGLRIAFIAVQTGSTTDVLVESSGFVSATSTGNQAMTTGHQTGFLFLCNSNAVSQNNISVTGSAGIGLWDTKIEVAVCITDDNEADPTDLNSIYRNRIVDLHNDAGAEVWEATMVSADATGFTFNYTTAPATARRGMWLSVQEMPLLLHQEETVTVSDSHLFVTSSIQHSETVTIADSSVIFVTSQLFNETVTVSDDVRFVGSITLIVGETVMISEDYISYTGQVLTVGETVTVTDAFLAASLQRTRGTKRQEIVMGGLAAGRVQQGGLERGDVL